MTFEFPRRRTAEQQFLYRRFLLHGWNGFCLHRSRKPVGYIYFYGFGGGLLCKVNGRSRSSAVKFEVHVSGISNLTDSIRKCW